MLNAKSLQTGYRLP